MRGKANPIVLLGMHRSGTSLVSNLLMMSGVKMGDSLLVADDNPHGHFEDLDFLNFHKQLLIKRGVDKSGLNLLKMRQFDPFSVDEVEEAKELLKLKRGHYGEEIWGWKDPRTVLFLDLWNQVDRVDSLIIFRDYNEVVNSLVKREISETIYPSRNFLKKIYWFCKYKLFRRWINDYYLKHWIIYNKILVEYFKSNCSERILVINSSKFLDSFNECILLINRKFNLDLDTESGLGIIDEKYFQRKVTLKYSKKNEAVALEMMLELKKMEAR